MDKINHLKFTAKQISDILHGDIAGNPDEEVFKLSKIEEGEKGSLTFLSNPKYNSWLYTTNASVVIVGENFVPEKEVSSTLIMVDDPYLAFTKLLQYYNEMKPVKNGFEDPHFMHDSVEYGEGLYLGAFSYLGKHVRLGKNVKIYPNVFIGDNVVIGDNTTLFAGSRVYCDSVIGNILLCIL